jgi:transposase-like protein
MYRSQTEAAKLLDVPESTLRSWIKQFRPYILRRPGENGHPSYEMDRLRELHYVCTKWAKEPVRRSLAEVGRELARRYPVEAHAHGITPPPSPDFAGLGQSDAPDAVTDAPVAARPAAAGSTEALAALSLLPDALERLIEATAVLAEIPTALAQAVAAHAPSDVDVSAVRMTEAGELAQLFIELKSSAAALAAVAPLLAEQAEANTGLQQAILAYLQAQQQRSAAPLWRWLLPSFWIALLLPHALSARDDTDAEQPEAPSRALQLAGRREDS